MNLSRKGFFNLFCSSVEDEGRGKKSFSDFVLFLAIDLQSYLHFDQLFLFILLANIELGDLVTIYSTKRAIFTLVFGYKHSSQCIVISNLFDPRCVETHIQMLRFPPVVCFGSGKTAIDSMVLLCRI